MVFAPDALPILTDVGEQRLFLFVEDAGDIDVGVRKKSLRLAAGIDFKKIEPKSITEVHAGANRQEARHLVIHVRVDRPMRENDVRIFFGEQFGHAIDMRFGDRSIAVDLAEENRFGADNLARGFAFRRPNPRRFVQTFVANAAFAAR